MRTLITFCLTLATSAAMGATFTGDLSSASGEIDGMQGWIDPGPTTIHWEVTDMTTHYHYKYILTVPESEGEVSHFIIEVSDLFGEDDFWSETGPFGSTEIGDFDQDTGNPSIPEAVHGLKFDEMWGTTAVVEFDCIRVPVWGDFYAKCGGLPPNEAWNEGFATPDPSDPPSDGTIANHILVPDSVIPEPTTLVLLLGVAGLTRRR